jgi:hypothetical protein
VRAADAEAIAKTGQAEAEVIEARFQAEAKGLREKFEAMKAMSPPPAHEEFRMRLDNAQIATLKAIDAQTSIAREQAEVLGTALANAKIDIVGGQGDYFDRFVNALVVGKGIDATIGKSSTLQVALKDHLSGERDMVGDVRDIVGALGGSAGELQNLSVAAADQGHARRQRRAAGCTAHAAGRHRQVRRRLTRCWPSRWLALAAQRCSSASWPPAWPPGFARPAAARCWRSTIIVYGASRPACPLPKRQRRCRNCPRIRARHAAARPAVRRWPATGWRRAAASGSIAANVASSSGSMAANGRRWSRPA